MKPTRLYIENFMCYDDAFVDFTTFNSALIVGKKEHSDDVSNGVGKTTIFRAVEYVLFNHSDIILENIVRDDVNSCNITFDFEVDGEEYRVTRTRTRKGATDLTLYRRNANVGPETEVLHTIKGDRYHPLSDEKYWTDISGRRSADTEKDLAKLIKANLKSFRIFVHFMQRDFTGLTTATPEKRKAILKDALNLIVYSKLEKMAKDKAGSLMRESDRISTLIAGLGEPDKDIGQLAIQLAQIEQELLTRSIRQNELTALLEHGADKVQKWTEEHAGLAGKFASLEVKEQTLNSEKSRLEISIKEYHSKKSNIVKAARDAVAELKQMEEAQAKLLEADYHQIEILNEQIITNKEHIAQFNLTVQNDTNRYNKLSIPMPDDGECEHCRQPLTKEHRKICQRKIEEEMAVCLQNIQNCKNKIAVLNKQNLAHQQNVNTLNLSKQHLDGLNTKIATKKKEVADKRTIHDEYVALLEKFMAELEEKNKEIAQVQIDLQNSSINEAKVLQALILAEKHNLTQTNNAIAAVTKEINQFNNNRAVIQHSINQKTEDKRKQIDYRKLLKELDVKLGMYPAVIQAFSTTGIPNLIIQNVLDDLQIEANNLLLQLKPGLQLSFFIEKTQGDGTAADTLDINYTVNGKKRYFEQLSGAMQLAVTFSLKLGLSFLLQKMIGVDIKFLLLDEVDQSLDKASSDAFADIVKFFQKDYTILVVTHNDRLKDKFSHAILVEQDINMVSRARVVSSW